MASWPSARFSSLAYVLQQSHFSPNTLFAGKSSSIFILMPWATSFLTLHGQSQACPQWQPHFITCWLPKATPSNQITPLRMSTSYPAACRPAVVCSPQASDTQCVQKAISSFDPLHPSTSSPPCLPEVTKATTSASSESCGCWPLFQVPQLLWSLASPVMRSPGPPWNPDSGTLGTGWESGYWTVEWFLWWDTFGKHCILSLLSQISQFKGPTHSDLWTAWESTPSSSPWNKLRQGPYVSPAVCPCSLPRLPPKPLSFPTCHLPWLTSLKSLYGLPRSGVNAS